MTSPSLPLPRALEVLARCSADLIARPSEEDLARLMWRGGASDEHVTWGDAAWKLLSTEEDRRVLFIAHAMLSDDEISASIGPLPHDCAARITAVASRIAPRMRTHQELKDRLLHEELARSIAAALNLPILNELDATTRFLLNSLDQTSKQMKAARDDYQRALNAARAAVDEKYRPARPYGE